LIVFDNLKSIYEITINIDTRIDTAGIIEYREFRISSISLNRTSKW